MRVNYTPWNNPPVQQPASMNPFPRHNLVNARTPPIISRLPATAVIQNLPNMALQSRSLVTYPPIPPVSIVNIQNPATIVPGIQRPAIHTSMPTSTVVGMPPVILPSSIQQVPGIPLQPNEVQATIVETNQVVGVFRNPFASPQASDRSNIIGVANSTTQTQAPVIQQAAEMGSQISNSMAPVMFSLNNQAANPINVANGQQGSQIQNQQLQPDTNSSLIRAQLNLSQNNDWQPIVTPRVYTFDYGFHG